MGTVMTRYFRMQATCILLPSTIGQFGCRVTGPGFHHVWRTLTLLKSRLSCFPEPWYPPWDRKSFTCSWTCSSSRCQQFSSSTLAPAVGSGAPTHTDRQTHTVSHHANICGLVDIVPYDCLQYMSSNRNDTPMFLVHTRSPRLNGGLQE